MGAQLALGQINPTVFLTGPEDALEQLVQVTIHNAGPARDAVLRCERAGTAAETSLTAPGPGESVHEVRVPVMDAPCGARFVLLADGHVLAEEELIWQAPRRWRVHLVQHSHHDVGYTNLPSTVLREHCQFLDSIIDMADETRAYPEDVRFRAVIEQAWSLQEFLRRAPEERVARMGALLASGDVELTALFGNLTTELCGHETLVRALYPAQQIARRFGSTITSAEHNDIPGMSWGLAQVLAAAGVRFFCPGLPRYWNWCDPAMQSFWDDAALFPSGQPGGFWWEAPSGRRVLLWDSGAGVGGDVCPDLPGLADRLGQLAGDGYPYDAVYWPVRGGARDNSPYIIDYAHKAREWNERWTYPRLVVSTNARFYADLRPELPTDLPVFAGELPGQDYPVGSASTAAATAANRRNHARLPAVERLAALAALTTDYDYPAATLDQAHEDALWHSEHTWGHHFPCGSGARASDAEKQVRAYRASALIHDTFSRSLARIADNVDLPAGGFYLVVCNPLPHPRTEPVVAPMREIENCGSTMVSVSDPDHPDQAPYLRGVPLADRWHVHPPAELVAGRFDLVDLSTGAVVDFQMVEIDGATDTVPYAPQRYGLAHGGKRYGFFEQPNGLGRDLHFIAQDLPAGGYKTYQLRPRKGPAAPAATSSSSQCLCIENEFYRIEADGDSGRITRLLDVETGRELLDDSAPHGLGELVVRTPEEVLEATQARRCHRRESGPVYQSLEIDSAAPGHPQVRLTVGLHRGIRRVEVAARILRDPTPLLDSHLAFPFALPDPAFRYESILACVTPIADHLPGAYWDELAVQSWVRISGGGSSLVWSSLDAPMVSMGRLHPGYVSPAHSCVVPDRADHPPAGTDALGSAHLYSLLFANNFGTNFAVSQCDSVLFRYRFTTLPREVSDAQAARMGSEAVTPFETIFAAPGRAGHLPASASLLALEGDALVALTCKRADDGRGLIARLWNPASNTAQGTIRCGFGSLEEALVTGLTEDDSQAVDGAGEVVERGGGSVTVQVCAREVATFRLIPAEPVRPHGT